jgi:hypothetical protein
LKGSRNGHDGRGKNALEEDEWSKGVAAAVDSCELYEKVMSSPLFSGDGG